MLSLGLWRASLTCPDLPYNIAWGTIKIKSIHFENFHVDKRSTATKIQVDTIVVINHFGTCTSAWAACFHQLALSDRAQQSKFVCYIMSLPMNEGYNGCCIDTLLAKDLWDIQHCIRQADSNNLSNQTLA